MDKAPDEGVFASKLDDSYQILIARSGDDSFECFKKHWAMEARESTSPAYLKEIDNIDENWEQIGTIERISEKDYDHYKVFRLFDGC